MRVLPVSFFGVPSLLFSHPLCGRGLCSFRGAFHWLLPRGRGLCPLWAIHGKFSFTGYACATRELFWGAFDFLHPSLRGHGVSFWGAFRSSAGFSLRSVGVASELNWGILRRGPVRS